jgi:DNA-binding response OmpR family regulator
MVVDDDPALLNLVKRILEREGFQVHAVDSGQACLDVLKKGFKGLILMDIMMPDMDGCDTIQRIVEQGYMEKNIVCMLTAKEIPDKKLNEYKEYILDYVTKPFDVKELVSVVKGYLSYLK